MSEQTNPTAEEQEMDGGVEATPERSEASAPVRTTGMSLRERSDDLDASFDDEEDEEEGEEGGDEDELYVSGPAEYVERERGGRGRRVGSDVRLEDIDYKNIPLLSRFLDRRGRILSRRKTRVTAKVQRRIVVAIKRARHMALLPYTADQTRIVRKRR
jgi:small subunit ribosomal protein S18